MDSTAESIPSPFTKGVPISTIIRSEWGSFLITSTELFIVPVSSAI